jgi:hypothetical protein
MGVPEMPASHAEHRTARDPGRGTLAPDLFRGSNGHARDIVCEGHVLAVVDATLASAGNGHREEQALGAAGVPGSLATKVGFRYRQAEIAGIAVVERLERTVGIASAVRWLRNAHVSEQFGVEKPTQKLQSFFSRWAIKFSAEYYEAKEQQASDVLSLSSSGLRTLR